MNQIIFLIVLLLAYVAVALTALNAMLMSVFERIPEIGMMKAVGVTPGQIILLTFIEAMVKTAAALVLAVLIGVPLTFYFQQNGIDLSMLMKGATISGIAFQPILYPKMTLFTLLTPLSILVVVVILSVVYPGIKAALIQPIDAMHHH
jgi:ABC-type antimicrobial peptide transport system permease subunit